MAHDRSAAPCWQCRDPRAESARAFLRACQEEDLARSLSPISGAPTQFCCKVHHVATGSKLDIATLAAQIQGKA